MFRIRSLYAVVALIAMMSSVVVAQEQTREEVRTVSFAWIPCFQQLTPLVE